MPPPPTTYVVAHVASDGVGGHVALEAAVDLVDLSHVDLHRSLVLGLDKAVGPRAVRGGCGDERFQYAPPLEKNARQSTAALPEKVAGERLQVLTGCQC